MTVKIQLKKIPSRISVKGVLNSTDAVTTLKKDGAGSNYDRLDSLKDVVEGLLPADGSTLVYDQETDKYVVQKITLDNIDADLDGGSF